jgi:5-methylthioadenosine/S-adenosylhomocysteine deaminase
MAGYSVVRGGTIITNDVTRRIIKNGAIVYEDDHILKVGKEEELSKEFEHPDSIIDARRKIIIPGIVQAHTHVMGHLFKGFTEDGAEDAFYKVCLPMEDYITREDAYWLSLVGCIEAVKFGTTMINDIFHYADVTAGVVEKVGIRGVIEQKVFDVKSLGKIGDMDYSRDIDAGMRRLKLNEELIRKWNGSSNGRIRCWVGNHAPDTNSPELLSAGRELADRYGVGIHIHVAQSTREVRYVKKEYGKTSVEFLNSLGFLRDDVVCAHLSFADPKDIAMLEASGAGMAHCPVIMGKFGSFPRIAEFLNSKVTIGLGSDWVSLNPWEDMRAAIEITRSIAKNISLQNAQRAFELATLGSAKLLKADQQVGSIEQGKKADIVIVDPNRPNLVPMRDVLQSLVYNMTGNEVETVICDGKPVVSNFRMVNVDEDSAIRRAQEVAERIWTESGVHQSPT